MLMVDWWTIISDGFQESVGIIMIIFFMMVVVELFVLRFKGRLVRVVERKGVLGYVVASLMGSIPGCIGTFAMDSLYMSGLASFGALIATMIATSGDEAFLMLSFAGKGEIPWDVLGGLFGLLFLLGLFGGWLADWMKQRHGWRLCEKCVIRRHQGEEHFRFRHFIREHVYEHILRKHLWKIFLWVFGAIVVINGLQSVWDISSLIKGTQWWIILLLAAGVGILPLSGPNIFLVTLFAQGMIPFSVLLTNSIVQDGHGLLPIMGFSLRDSYKIKLFNVAFGLVIGSLVMLLGW